MVGPEEEESRAPDGVELVSLAERPDLSRAVYAQLAVEALADIPVERLGYVVRSRCITVRGPVPLR